MARRGGDGRLTCESCMFVDIRYWKRRGLLHGNSVFPLYFSRAGMPCGYVSVFVESDAGVTLTFGICRSGDIKPKTVEQQVSIVWTPCHLGGRRPWLRCPQCEERAAILYGAGEFFTCRRCHGLAYASQQETPRQRNISRARKIRMRLGGGESLCDPFPPKPQRMHRRTYDRIRARGEAADLVAFGQFRLARRLQRQLGAARSV
jgi:hypothetical protein